MMLVLILGFPKKFLKGDNDDSQCAELFKMYQQCVANAIKRQNIELKDITVDVLGTDKEQTAPNK